MVYSNSLLIVTGYYETFAKVNLTIRNLCKGQFLPPAQIGKLADAVFKMYIEGLTHVYDTIAGDDDINSAEFLVRFVIFGTAFGPEWVLVTYKDLDGLWKKLQAHTW